MGILYFHWVDTLKVISSGLPSVYRVKFSGKILNLTRDKQRGENLLSFISQMCFKLYRLVFNICEDCEAIVSKAQSGQQCPYVSVLDLLLLSMMVYSTKMKKTKMCTWRTSVATLLYDRNVFHNR